MHVRVAHRGWYTRWATTQCKNRYDMRKLISIAASGLGLCWLTGQIMFQLFVVETPRPAFYWLNAGNALQIVAALLALALLLVTNTRRPRGIDPDTPVPAKKVDPFALSAEEE